MSESGKHLFDSWHSQEWSQHDKRLIVSFKRTYYQKIVRLEDLGTFNILYVIIYCFIVIYVVQNMTLILFLKRWKLKSKYVLPGFVVFTSYLCTQSLNIDLCN